MSRATMLCLCTAAVCTMSAAGQAWADNWPVPAAYLPDHVSAEYGKCGFCPENPRLHEGTDFPAPAGTDVLDIRDDAIPRPI